MSNVGLNLDHVRVDSQTGRVSVAGARSGLDWADLVDKVIQAKSIPIDMVSKKITAAEEKLALMADLQAKTVAVKNALSTLYGAHVYDKSADIFEKKTDTASFAMSGAQASGSLRVSVTNMASLGRYDVEIDSVASSHKILSGSLPMALNAACNLNGALILKDPVSGLDLVQINISPDDSLLTIVDKINVPENSVAARVINANQADHRIVLQSKIKGSDYAIVFSESSDQSLIESGTGFGFATLTNGHYINNHVITNASDAVITIDSVQITRPSNVIDDAIRGVTLQVSKPTLGDAITVSVDQDIDAIKQKIGSFVQAYNELITQVNFYAHFDPDAQKQNSLYGSSFIRTLKSTISSFLTMIPLGTSEGKTLATVGIRPFTNYEETKKDYQKFGNLEIDDDIMTQAMLDDWDGFRQFFALDFVSSDAELTLSKFQPSILPLSASSGILNIITDGQNITGASFSEGDVVINNQSIQIISGNAKGLTLNFWGKTSRTIQINYTIGIAVQAMHVLNGLLGDAGVFTQSLKNTQDSVQTYGQDKKQMTDRMDRQKKVMLKQFERMEAALSQTRTTMEHLKELFNRNSEH